MIRLAALLMMMAPASAGAFSLDLPLDCTLNDTCYIQQYQDRDPGPSATDFTCGPLSYDGHKGTDIAVPTLRDMQNGVTVRAGAAGTVTGTRDGMPDIASNTPGAPEIDGKECGNGLVIDHGDGWETQYCHMAKGSVRVRKGDTVAAGTPLGLIGLSGNTEFPHLHLSVRKDGVEIDPFDPDGAQTCGPGPVLTLWATDIPYTPGGLIGAGFADQIPVWEAVKAGLQEPPLKKTAPALVLWVHYFGSRAGDRITLTITGPQGEILAETVMLDRTQAQGFRAVGKRLRAPNWPSGPYIGEISLIRDGATIDTRRVAATIP